jgi:DNA-binding HxlR family transcriptional regulator
MKDAARSYHQYCGMAKALDVLGERWTLLILRELLLGPRRYTDLQASLAGITTNLLAQRLQRLEREGVIARERLPPPAASQVYALTAAGWELEPALLALGRWGWRYMERPAPGDVLSIDWALVALKRRYVPGARRWTLELRPDAKVFQLRPAGGRLEVRHGTPWEPQAVVVGTDAAFRALLLGQAPPAALRKAGRLRVQGDEAAWRAFLADLGFALPGRAPGTPARRRAKSRGDAAGSVA